MRTAVLLVLGILVGTATYAQAPVRIDQKRRHLH